MCDFLRKDLRFTISNCWINQRTREKLLRTLSIVFRARRNATVAQIWQRRSKDVAKMSQRSGKVRKKRRKRSKDFTVLFGDTHLEMTSLHRCEASTTLGSDDAGC